MVDIVVMNTNYNYMIFFKKLVNIHCNNNEFLTMNNKLKSKRLVCENQIREYDVIKESS